MGPGGMGPGGMPPDGVRSDGMVPGDMAPGGGVPGVVPDALGPRAGMEAMMRRMGAPGLVQGAAMDLVEFVVGRAVDETHTIPETLAILPPAERDSAERERVFRFQSAMMAHGINGRPFEMERVDERVPFGSTEVWRFVNEAPFPHPVHMHGTRFRVLERRGGRAEVFPWEQGWKDTVLVFPGEEVDVLATFDRHRGLYLLHCHNLEHEDGGMMMNFVVE